MCPRRTSHRFRSSARCSTRSRGLRGCVGRPSNPGNPRCRRPCGHYCCDAATADFLPANRDAMLMAPSLAVPPAPSSPDRHVMPTSRRHRPGRPLLPSPSWTASPTQSAPGCRHRRRAGPADHPRTSTPPGVLSGAQRASEPGFFWSNRSIKPVRVPPGGVRRPPSMPDRYNRSATPRTPEGPAQGGYGLCAGGAKTTTGTTHSSSDVPPWT